MAKWLTVMSATSFPCDRLKTLNDRYKERYKMSMIENLSFIKEHGMQNFLEEQAKTVEMPELRRTH